MLKLIEAIDISYNDFKGLEAVQIYVSLIEPNVWQL